MKEEIYDLTYELEETYWWYAARRRIIVSQVQPLLAAYPSNSRPRILEYGCGTGITLSTLSSQADVFGMDVSKQALAYCENRGLKNLHYIDSPHSLTGKNPFDEPFDVILMLDVLEHVDEETNVLQMIRTWLKPGGSLLLTVPAYSFLWSGEDVVSHHLRRYTKRSLHKVLAESGFDIQRESYFNFFLFPMQAGVILFNRLFRPHLMQETNLKLLPSVLNDLLTRIMSMESHILRYVNLPVGGSVLGIATPRVQSAQQDSIPDRR